MADSAFYGHVRSIPHMPRRLLVAVICAGRRLNLMSCYQLDASMLIEILEQAPYNPESI